MILSVGSFFAFILSFFSRGIGRKIALILFIGSVFISLILGISLGKTVLLERISTVYTYEWISIDYLDIKFKFLYDPLSLTLSLLIIIITLLVMLYAYGYMEEDPHLVTFMASLTFFCFAMLLMVTGGNLIQLFIGWEAVGLASYLLISFWNTRNEANKGGLKAVIVNRIGDIFFLLGLGVLWYIFKSFDIGIINSAFQTMLETKMSWIILDYNIDIVSFLACCLLVAASAKSAQLVLQTWLPDATEGPTPVSALLHSATMVTAGIFLIIRCSYLFAYTPKISMIMAALGAITALVAAITAHGQYDLKRIIAFSTCSQLGFMFMTIGLGFYHLALFHLITHAIFKSLLFLCSGVIIHALHNEQDARKMGGLYMHLRLPFICMLLGSFALTGIPFLAGFYSKDLLLEAASASANFGYGIFCIGTFVAFLTSFYTVRSLLVTFFGKLPAIPKFKFLAIAHPPFIMIFSLVVLSFLSVVSGYFLEDLFLGPNASLFFSPSLPPAFGLPLEELEYIPLSLKLLPTFASLFGFISGFFVHTTFLSTLFALSLYYFSNLSSQKFYLDSLYNFFFSKPTLAFGYQQYTVIDRGLLELLGPTGLSHLVAFLSLRFKLFHQGSLFHSLLLFFVFILIVFLLLVL